MDGQLLLKSEEGKGSGFVTQLPIVTTCDSPQEITEESSASITHSPLQHIQTPSLLTDGEVRLVDKECSTKVDAIFRNRAPL